MLLVAAFLVGLGVFAIFVEGPLLSVRLKTSTLTFAWAPRS